MKRILPLPLCLAVCFFSSTPVHASGFYLKSIGSLTVESAAYSHYWYTGSSPTLVGVAPADSTVTVTIDSVSGTTAADSSGTWSYATTIGEGDHTITLSTPSATDYTFTLTIGVTPDGVSGITPAETPPAGTITPTLLLLFGASLLLLTPFALKKVT